MSSDQELEDFRQRIIWKFMVLPRNEHGEQVVSVPRAVSIIKETK
jgi:hypothetical protein